MARGYGFSDLTVYVLHGFPLSLDWGFFQICFYTSGPVLQSWTRLSQLWMFLFIGTLSFGLMIVSRLVWLGLWLVFL